MLHVVYWQSLFDKNTADGAPLALLTTRAAIHGKKVTIRIQQETRSASCGNFEVGWASIISLWQQWKYMQLVLSLNKFMRESPS